MDNDVFAEAAKAFIGIEERSPGRRACTTIADGAARSIERVGAALPEAAGWLRTTVVCGLALAACGHDAMTVAAPADEGAVRLRSSGNRSPQA